MEAQQGWEKSASQEEGSGALALGSKTPGQLKNTSSLTCNVISQDVHMSLSISDPVKEVSDATLNKEGVPPDAPITDKSNGTMMPLLTVLFPALIVILNAARVQQGINTGCGVNQRSS